MFCLPQKDSTLRDSDPAWHLNSPRMVNSASATESAGHPCALRLLRIAARTCLVSTASATLCTGWWLEVEGFQFECEVLREELGDVTLDCSGIMSVMTPKAKQASCWAQDPTQAHIDLLGLSKLCTTRKANDVTAA